MRVRSKLAEMLAHISYFGLHTVLGRGASQLPGRVALSADPNYIAHAAARLTGDKIVVCGTNGKTTTNNLIASALETKGAPVAANREGANMAAGVASALAQNSAATSCSIEADELSTTHIVPALKPKYLLLLNLFRDQLDRAGEIDRVQDVLVEALTKSPDTTLIVCGDDPLSVGVARRAESRGSKVISFGIQEDLHTAEDRVPEARFCQVCGAELSYSYKVYAQLGNYSCPACDFKRPELDYFAHDISVGEGGIDFSISSRKSSYTHRIHTQFTGIYMIYNILAAYAASDLFGVSVASFDATLQHFAPKNGRLQHFDIEGVHIILNLAKNPTGFNQNIALINAEAKNTSSFIVINDNFNDGKDVSWLWDVDFERLTEQDRLFVGGLRAHDMQVRLKYAGRSSEIISSASEAISALKDASEPQTLYILCNYSALWPIKAELEALEA